MHDINYPCVYKKISKDTIEVWFVGDVHLISIACDREKLNEVINTIKSRPNAYWIGTGDYAEFIYPGDPRIDYSFISDEVESPQGIADMDEITQKKIEQTFLPIKNKCLGILEGNHEKSRNRRFFSRAGKRLAETLGTEFLGYEGFIVIELGKTHTVPITIWISHGFGGGRKWGSHIDRLREMTQSFNADIFCAAHNHDIGAFRDTYFTTTFRDNKPIVIQKERLFIRTGSFRKRMSDSYEAQAGYSNQAIGSPYVILSIDPKSPWGFQMTAKI